MGTDMDANRPRPGMETATRTVDRIAEPWGTRTPYGPGEEWPVRVDQFLEEGISEEDVDRWSQTASLHHSDGDGIGWPVRLRTRPFRGFSDGFLANFTERLIANFRHCEVAVFGHHPWSVGHGSQEWVFCEIGGFVTMTSPCG